MQHLEEKVKDIAPKGRPIWGSFSWIQLEPDRKQFKISVYVPGRLAKAKGIPVVNPASREFHDQIDHFEMALGANVVNLSETMREVDDLRRAFEASLFHAPMKIDCHGEGILSLDLDATS